MLPRFWKHTWGWGQSMALVTEHLPSNCDALSSKPIYYKKDSTLFGISVRMGTDCKWLTRIFSQQVKYSKTKLWLRQARIMERLLRKILHFNLTRLWLKNCFHLPWEPPMSLSTHWLLDGKLLVSPFPQISRSFKSTWRREAPFLCLQLPPGPHLGSLSH
jgi:hypothetical protein